MDEMSTVRITWDAAPSPVVQKAEMIAFYAAQWPSTAGDPSELDDFRL